jgi:hypothetical protein
VPSIGDPSRPGPTVRLAFEALFADRRRRRPIKWRQDSKPAGSWRVRQTMQFLSCKFLHA